MSGRIELDFEWVPMVLIQQAKVIVDDYHGRFGYGELFQTLWHKETNVMIACHNDLRVMAAYGSKGLFKTKRKNDALAMVVAIVLAVEMIGSDFAGWGSLPDERVRADAVLNEYLAACRTRLLDIYLPNRANLDGDLLKAFGPR